MTLGTDEIRTLLPHRYPMLLVDRVTSLAPGQALTATKAVTANEPWFADGRSLAYPQVLLIESWCQAASLLAAGGPLDTAGGDRPVPLFGAISRIAFHRPVGPGDLLEHRVRLLRALSDTWMFEGETTVDDETVLTVERVTIALRPGTELRPRTPAAEPV
ncbi:3-hydroxyacyl-[acyl-carrier-protein] dehydratase FabZ [Longispora fulva]|uniref:3-hydroxyacyl-[acyl-carrier-protein] dehydratase n=1 Tax=Longispora fulva TaxID=619741 RepID=A0A8J7KUR1_9ACTN|nr:beta-hydroxyacyl-ACP dehydratase [Longispora fulva]MBG6134327.1 3-hydroxyacyl-[acyl-carrier-protein] dehydratase [Longispora fulva]GIG63037.1 3-hydroxyacyl-[acyl-carrier-protein] dehydratase FabZ [Longispora fulva]